MKTFLDQLRNGEIPLRRLFWGYWLGGAVAVLVGTPLITTALAVFAVCITGDCFYDRGWGSDLEWTSFLASAAGVAVGLVLAFLYAVLMSIPLYKALKLQGSQKKP